MSESNIRSGTVTSIEDQVLDPERVNVFIDGAFAFGLNRLVASERGLFVGQDLEARQIEALLAADEVARAVAAALQFLAYRARSVNEVRRRLARRSFGPESIEAAIQRLRDWRYIDDESFARAWVENRIEHQPRGKRLLKQELREKGIDSTLAEQAIEDAELDEFPGALALARKRLPSYASDDPLARRRRLTAFLQRRGYGWDVVKRVLDTLLGEDDVSEADL